jgi:hypothetical protein
MSRNIRCAMALLWALLAAAPLARAAEAPADTTPPVIKWQRPGEGEVFLTPYLSLFIDVVVSEEANGSGLAMDRLTAQLDGRPLPERCWYKRWYKRPDESTLQVYDFDLRRCLSDGPHEITITARDLAGNEARDSRRFVLDRTQPSLWGITGSVLTPTARTTYGRGFKFGLYHNDERTLAIYDWAWAGSEFGFEGAYQIALDATPKNRNQSSGKFCFTARRPGRPAVAFGAVNDKDGFLVLSYEWPGREFLVDIHGGWGEGPLGKWFGGLSLRGFASRLALDHSKDGWNYAWSYYQGKGLSLTYGEAHLDGRSDWFSGITYVLPLD